MLSVLVLAGCLAAPSAWARGNLSQPLTVLVIPARHTMVQLGMDVIQRHRVVLVAYQGEASTASPVLHVWDGAEWRGITLDDFRIAAYLKYPASRIVLVGDDATLPAAVAEAAGEASPIVMGISTLETAGVVNELGEVFGFKSRDWSWFAKRYNLDLSDDNEPLRKVSWYDKPYNRSGGEAVAPVSGAVQADVPPATGIPPEEDIPAATVIGGGMDAAVSAESGWSESAETSDLEPVK